MLFLLSLLPLSALVTVVGLFTTSWGLGCLTGLVLFLGALMSIHRPARGWTLLILAVAAVTTGYVLDLRERLGSAATDIATAVTRAEKAEADARHLAGLAQANAAAALSAAADSKRQAEAYRADAVQARSDAKRFDLAQESAEIARRASACPDIVKDVKGALIGPARSPEDAPLPGSLKAAMEALTSTKGGRRAR